MSDIKNLAAEMSEFRVHPRVSASDFADATIVVVSAQTLSGFLFLPLSFFSSSVPPGLPDKPSGSGNR